MPLHTNGSDNDMRSHVTRKNVSGSTRSDRGRDYRDGIEATDEEEPANATAAA